MTIFWFHRDWATLRPWLAGLVVLAGLVWGISWLLDAQQITGDQDSEERGAAAPAATGTPAATASNAVPVPLADLLPLGPEDDGFRVVVRGTVVGEPTGEGIWILTDEDEVLFVRTAQPATSGEDQSLTGTLHQVAGAEGAAWAVKARLREAAGWKVHHNLYLEVEGAGAAASGSATTRPGPKAPSSGSAAPGSSAAGKPGSARATRSDTTT